MTDETTFVPMSDADRAQQQAIESAIQKVIAKAQQEWGSGDHVTLGALLNLLCYGMVHHSTDDEQAIRDLIKVLPEAMRDARATYRHSMYKAGRIS